jgi:hypothetical protein
MDELKNDRGGTESEPYKYFAGSGDVRSWSRLHLAYWDSVREALRNAAASATPEGLEAGEWVEASEELNSYANPSFGFQWTGEGNAEKIGEIIASAKQGQAHLASLQSAGVPAEKPDTYTPPDAGKEVRLFVGGAVLAGLAYLAYRASKGRVSA